MALIPFLITALFFLGIRLVVKKFTVIDRRLLIFLSAQILYNFFLFLITKNHFNFVASWYLIFNTIFFILFFENEISKSIEKIMIAVLYLNAMCCAVEIAFGMLAFYNNVFYESYMAVSTFFTTEKGILYNTYGLQRAVGNYLVLIRPSGLLGNLHLSSFAIFILYAYALFKDYTKAIRWILVFLIFLSGNIQTMLCFFVLKLLLINFKDLKTMIAAFLSVITIALISFITYGKMEHTVENNMFRIIYDSGRLLLSTSLLKWLIGANPYELIQSRSEDFLFSNSLIESGFFRYTMTFGLINIVLGIMVVMLVIKKKGQAYKRIAFFLAVLASTIHYSMYTTLIGGMLVAFLITSQFNDEISK